MTNRIPAALALPAIAVLAIAALPASATPEQPAK